MESEFEVPPNTKLRVVATVHKAVVQEMRLIHEQEIRQARDEDRCEPDWSNTVEMLLRKGAKAYRQQAPRKEGPTIASGHTKTGEDRY